MNDEVTTRHLAEAYRAKELAAVGALGERLELLTIPTSRAREQVQEILRSSPS